MKKIYILISLILLIILLIIYFFILPGPFFHIKGGIPNGVPIKADGHPNLTTVTNHTNPPTISSPILFLIKETKGYPINVTIFGGESELIEKNSYWCKYYNYNSALTEIKVSVDAITPGDPYSTVEHAEGLLNSLNLNDNLEQRNITIPDITGSMTFTPDFTNVSNERYYFYDVKNQSPGTIVTIEEKYDTLNIDGRTVHISNTHDIPDNKIIYLYYKPGKTNNYLLILRNGVVKVNSYYM